MGRDKTIVFLSRGNSSGWFAGSLLASTIRRMGLPWRCVTGGLPGVEGKEDAGARQAAVQALQDRGVRDMGVVGAAEATGEDIEQAAVLVVLNGGDALGQQGAGVPGFSGLFESWQVGEGLESFAAIESRVMDLMARMLGGGGNAPPEESAVPERKAAKEKASKPILVKVGRETAGRRGKGVTTVFDTPLGEAALLDLAARLKQRCGTGGTVKNGRIEIQGDQRDRIVAELEKLGYRVKRAGG